MLLKIFKPRKLIKTIKSFFFRERPIRILGYIDLTKGKMRR
jgi:hypothetical protein